jgi:hypothetical protein
MAMKTICDVCGTECTAATGRLSLTIEHRVSTGEQVAEDFYLPIDLCGEHAEAARLRYRFRVAQQGESITGEGLARYNGPDHG